MGQGNCLDQSLVVWELPTGERESVDELWKLVLLLPLDQEEICCCSACHAGVALGLEMENEGALVWLELLGTLVVELQQP